MNNTSIPPLIQSRLSEIDAALEKFAEEKDAVASQAEKLHAKARDIEIQMKLLQAERLGHDRWISALDLAEAAPMMTRKSRTMVENKALPLLKNRGAMNEAALAVEVDVGDGAFYGWVSRAVNQGKITRSEDGTLEAL